MIPNLSNIEGVCHDFDGVFYPFSAFPDIHNAFALANAVAICKLMPNILSLDDAIKLADEGYKQHGDAVTGPMIFAQKNGFDGEAFRVSLFREYHKEALSYIKEKAPHLFKHDHTLIKAFAQHNGRIKNGIATHGCAIEWTRPFLIEKGLSSHIQDKAIVGLADGDFISKNISPLLVAKCLGALETSADKSAFVEDTSANLKIAKEHYPLLRTIFIHHGKPIEQKPSHIDFQFRDLAEFHAALHIAHTQSRHIILT